jgi:hypothetical protein
LPHQNSWKQSNTDTANKNFQTKFDALKQEYDELVAPRYGTAMVKLMAFK